MQFTKTITQHVNSTANNHLAVSIVNLTPIYITESMYFPSQQHFLYIPVRSIYSFSWKYECTLLCSWKPLKWRIVSLTQSSIFLQIVWLIAITNSQSFGIAFLWNNIYWHTTPVYQGWHYIAFTFIFYHHLSHPRNAAIRAADLMVFDEIPDVGREDRYINCINWGPVLQPVWSVKVPSLLKVIIVNVTCMFRCIALSQGPRNGCKNIMSAIIKNKSWII
jgi:hypothetical protein